MVASSSSSATMKKSTKLSPIQKTVFKKSLIKRQETVFNKAYELSVLCGIEVCVICYGPDGELKTWPGNTEYVKNIAGRYNELSMMKRRRGSVNLSEFLKKINKADRNNNKKNVRLGSQVKFPVWDARFDNYSEDQLTELTQSLMTNLTRFQQRLGVVLESQGQRKIQNTDMADNQKPMMPSTMNHHQQNSNQVSLSMYGSLSPIPVSTLASASNQAQSLAPLPSELAIYPNSNVGNYSWSLGVQETGINGFQNMNMYTYDNNNNNGLNDFGFQNMNMYTYDNNNNIITNGLNDFGLQNMNMYTYDNNNNNIINGVNDFPKQFNQNSKVESYLGVLGGINEFGNTSMYSCNLNAENYSGALLGWQETGTNALQNMNMYDYYNNDYNINVNDLSHQFGVLTATTAPGFQFGSDGNKL